MTKTFTTLIFTFIILFIIKSAVNLPPLPKAMLPAGVAHLVSNAKENIRLIHEAFMTNDEITAAHNDW